MKKFLSLIVCSLSLVTCASDLIWYPFVGPRPLVNSPNVVLSMTLDTDQNGTHPTLHIRGTEPGVQYMLIESTGMDQLSWQYYWAKVPFTGDADVSVLLTNQCMFFRTQTLP